MSSTDCDNGNAQSVEQQAAPIVRVGLACILIKKPNLVLIGKRAVKSASSSHHGQSKIQLPGGHLEFGESWEQCCAREVKEETDIDISRSTLFHVTNDVMVQDKKHYITVFMLAEVNEEEPKNMEPHKNEYWRWVTWHDLRHDAEYRDNLFMPLHQLVHGTDKDPFVHHQ